MLQKIKEKLYIVIAMLTMVPGRVSATIDIKPGDEPFNIVMDNGMEAGNAGVGVAKDAVTAVNILMGAMIGLVMIALIRNIVMLAMYGENPSKRQEAIHNMILSFVGLGIIGGAWSLGALFFTILR